MNYLRSKEPIINSNQNANNKEIESLSLTETLCICSCGSFENCTSLKNVYFGLDISRIGNRTFANCKNLTDVWFAITDENKIVEIAEDAFYGCSKQITFHIFVSAIKNKYLNEYAKRHNFKVAGMI